MVKDFDFCMYYVIFLVWIGYMEWVSRDIGLCSGDLRELKIKKNKAEEVNQKMKKGATWNIVKLNLRRKFWWKNELEKLWDDLMSEIDSVEVGGEVRKKE
jgi:hypothetical protein